MMPRPAIKICGLRRPEDALCAVELGATHVGCVLAADSPRRASAAEVLEIAAAVGDSAILVLVFRRNPPAEIAEVCAESGVRRIQVHGADEATRRFLARSGLIVHRVYTLDRAATALPAFDPLPTPICPAVLDVGEGGTGERFDWRVLGAEAPHATFVAGGIAPDNIQELLHHRPWGIDLSSGVEREPGIKDHDRLRRLFEAIEVCP